MAEEESALRRTGTSSSSNHARNRSRSSAQPLDLDLYSRSYASSSTLAGRSPGLNDMHATSVPNSASSIWNLPPPSPAQPSSLAIDTSALEDLHLAVAASSPQSTNYSNWDRGGARSFSYDYSGLRSDSRYQGGIASTNVSPFTRDGHTLPGFGDYRNASPTAGAMPLGLGPVGSGRKRADPWGSRPASYTHEHVDEESDEEHPPTRSGATSRRHSLAAFTSSTSSRAQFGFDIPSMTSTQNKDESRRRTTELPRTGLRFDDDELADSLNSLQLSMGQQQLREASMQSPRSSSLPRIAPIGSPRVEQPPGFGPPPALGRNMQQQQQQPSFFNSTVVNNAVGSSPQARMTGLPSNMAGNQFGSLYGQGQQQQPQMSRGANMLPSAGPQYGGLNRSGSLSANAPPFPASSSGFDANTRPVYFGAQTHQEPDLHEFGRGIPLHQVPFGSPLCIVEFKPGRTDIFYLGDPSLRIAAGDVVIVEADRGKDLGTVVHNNISMDDVQAFQKIQVEQALGQLAGAQGSGQAPNPHAISRLTREVHPKRLLGKASPTDLQLLASKASDEAKALALVQNKVMQKGLDMEVVDAEWQFDRRKLTIFYIANKRIDFRELVRELFRLFKTRLWMAPVSLPPPPPSHMPDGLAGWHR